MSWTHNISNFAKSVGGVFKAPIGLFNDIATMPFHVAGIDPNEGLHAIGKAYNFVNDLPPVSATFDAWDKVRHEAVSQPLATVETALPVAFNHPDSSGQLPGAMGGLQNLFRPSTWADAYHIAEHRSPGEAMYMAMKGMTPFAPESQRVDVLDPNDVANAKDDTLFHVVSGITDFALAMSFDPVTHGLGALGKGRKLAMVRKATPGGGEAYANSDPFRITADWAKGKTQSEILQHPSFKSSPRGAELSAIVVQAAKGKNPDDDLRKVFRIGHGDAQYLDSLANENAQLADMVGNIFNPKDEFLARQMVGQSAAGFPNLHTVDIDKVNRKLELLAQGEHDINFNERLMALHGSLADNLPGGLNATTARLQTKQADLRQAFRSERVYGQPFFGTALRVVLWAPMQLAHANPKGWINYNRNDSWKDLEDELRVRGVSPELRQQLVDNYLKAEGTGGRKIAKEKAERVAYAAILESKGVSKSAVQASLNAGWSRRDRLMQQIQSSRIYSTAEHNGARADFFYDDGIPTAMPLLRTHLADSEPVMDLKRVELHASRHANAFRALGAGPRDFVTDGADLLNSAWKFNVLFRPPGYTLRLLGGDHFAIWAKLGVMADVLNAGKGTGNLLRNTNDRVVGTALRQILPEGQLPADLKKPFSARRIGQEERTLKLSNGEEVKYPGAFGGEHGEIFSQEVSADSGYHQFLDETSGRRMAHIMGQAKWDRLNPAETEEPIFLDAWTDAINRQTMHDPLAKMIVKGVKDGDTTRAATDEDLWKWLTRNPKGMAYRKEMAWWSLDPMDMIGRVRAHVDNLIPEGSLRDYVKATGRVSPESIKKALPDKNVWPDVHGPGVIGHNVPNRGWGQFYKGTTDKIMRGLGSLPTDVLSRHPVFSNVYDEKMRRLLEMHGAELGEGETISNAMVDVYSKTAREHALRETHKLLIDVARQSNAAHFMRFLMPFFGAWEQEMGRWMRIFYDTPEAARKAQMVWNSPNRLGIVVDQNGDKVAPNRPLSDQDKIQIQLPKAAQKALGVEGYSDKFVFSKNSLNLALQGQPWWSPGAGPVAQIPVNELVKNKPEWSGTNAAKFILPYGPSQKWTDIIKSTPQRRLDALMSDDDPASRNIATMILQTEMTNYALHKRSTPPTMQEIQQKAHHLKAIRFVSSFAMPFQPRFETPYQFYIDQYHKLRASDYRTADEQFLDKYGPDYFGFAQSVSKNNTGIPASIAAVKASRKYSDLIGRFPDFGSLIVGPEGGGTFDQAAYYYQLSQPIGPMASTKYRESVPPDEVWKSNRMKLGWLQYMKFMNQIEALRIDNGLDKVQDSDELMGMKRAWLEQKAKENPDWMKDYSTHDTRLAQERADALTQIAADKRMVNNPDRSEMSTVLSYLELRQQMLAELKNRRDTGGSASIDAQDNADLLATWEAQRAQMVSSDLRFNDIFYRYLEHDMPVAG